MRQYRTEEYKESLIGNTFNTTDTELEKYNGLKVKCIICELNDKEYERELLDDGDRNSSGKRRYEMNCMYDVQLENDKIITVFEDEINPNYNGDYEN